MKLSILSLTVFFLFASNTNHLAQDFPVGVFSAGLDENVQNKYINEIVDLGVNWVIHTPTKSNIKDLNKTGLNLIVHNGATANNIIYYYSGGYYSKWQAEEKLRAPRESGIKRGTNGQIVKIEGKTCWTNQKNVNTPNFLSGPNYVQNLKYRMFYISNPEITYKASVNLKVEGSPVNLSNKVCEIRAEYIFDHVGKDGKVAVDKILLGKKIINLNDPGVGKFTDYAITYNLNQAIEREKTRDANRLAGFNDTKGTYGINIVVDYLGERKIYIDHIEIYDSEIGQKIRNNPEQVEKEIISFVDKMSSLKNIKFYYGLDEPQSPDNYQTFEFVNRTLKKNGKPPLITTFYPYWTGMMNGDNTTERFVNLAKPDRLMFYYYPVLRKRWSDPNSPKGSFELYDTFRNLLHQTSLQRKDFFAMVQCHAFQEKSISDNLWLRQPSPEELNAQVMLALAHGAKGIFFYNFFSNYSHDAILDKNFNKTPLFGKIKDDISPRLRGNFGKILLNLEYAKQYIQHRSSGKNISNAGYLSISDTRSKGEYNYHIGLLKDRSDMSNNYFLIVNLLSAQKKNSNPIRINISNPLAGKYTNMRLWNIEGGIDIIFNQNVSLDDDLGGGEGHLYRVSPVVRSGGTLKYNESITGTEELRGEIMIEPGVELTINGVYNIYQNIKIKSGAKVSIGKSGKINYFNGAKLIES